VAEVHHSQAEIPCTQAGPRNGTQQAQQRYPVRQAEALKRQRCTAPRQVKPRHRQRQAETTVHPLRRHPEPCSGPANGTPERSRAGNVNDENGR